MLIRKATTEDIDSVAEIYFDTHTAEENGLVNIGWIRDVYPTAETANQALLRGDLFVMEDNGIVVGTAIINKIQVESYRNARWNHPAPDNKVMVLHTLVISPKAPRKGFGKSFVSFYEQYALSNGCPYLRLDTNAKNTRARSMYQKLGYKEIGIVPCSFNGIDGVNLVLLEKLLPSNI